MKNINSFARQLFKNPACAFCYPISPWLWVANGNSNVKLPTMRSHLLLHRPRVFLLYMPHKHFSNEMLHGIWMQWKYLLGHLKGTWILGRNIRSHVIMVNTQSWCLKAESEHIFFCQDQFLAHAYTPVSNVAGGGAAVHVFP